MNFLDKKETINWLVERGLSDSKGTLLLSGYPNATRFTIPADSGKKTVLSKIISSFFQKDNQILLWINEYGIWPSSEDQNLFRGFRQSLDENSLLFEKPGHICSNSELETMGSLLAMVFYFCWGAVLVSTTKNFIMRISHDEIIDLFVKDSSEFSEIQTKLKELIEKR